MAAPTRVHLVTGGFPVGSHAGHDMDYARLRILQILSEMPSVIATTSNDFADVETWLPGCALLLTYVAGPFPDPAQNRFLRTWLEDGGRWLGLHGTSGGKAAPVEATGACARWSRRRTTRRWARSSSTIRRSGNSGWTWPTRTMR